MIFLATSWKLILEPPRASSAGARTVRGEQKESPRAAGQAAREDEREVRDVSLNTQKAER
jgi:hypothetical protein